MRAAPLRVSILIVAIALPSAAGAQRLFEGSVTYDVVADGKPSQFVITARNSRVRQDTSIPDSAGVTTANCEVFDYQHGTITTISPSTKRFTRAAMSTYRETIGDPRSITELRALEA